MYVSSDARRGDRLIGVCWDDPRIGNCDGELAGMKCFHCAPQQGSFVKSYQLYQDVSEDDVLQSLCCVTSELERALNTPSDRFVKIGCAFLGAVSVLCTWYHAVAHWLNRTIAMHHLLLDSEAFLAAQKQKKSNTVEKELAVDDLRSRLNNAFADRVAVFQETWQSLAPIRNTLGEAIASTFAQLIACLDVSNLDVAGALDPARERITDVGNYESLQLLFSQYHLS